MEILIQNWMVHFKISLIHAPRIKKSIICSCSQEVLREFKLLRTLNTGKKAQSFFLE